MEEINITNAMLLRARSRAAKMPKLKNSIRHQRGKLVGLLGEEIVKKFFNVPVKQDEAGYEFDIVSPDGLRLEVKTKERSVVPKLNYECSVARYNDKQDCDLYVFVSVLNDYSKGWVCGWLSPKSFKKKSTKFKKGDKDPSNNFTFRADCRNIKISDLDCDL
jgi:hypothetical protein